MSSANATLANTANGQADRPAPRERPTPRGGATDRPGGPRRPRGGAPSPAALTLVSILARIAVALALVPLARVPLPDVYFIVKDSVTEQLLLRCCLLEEDQRRLLQSVYTNLSLPTMSDTQYLRNLARCVIYPKERVECLRLRSRYGHNVLTLLEPWDSFTVYNREQGPGSVHCKHFVFSRLAALVIVATNALLLAVFCYLVYTILYVFTILGRLPARAHTDTVGRGGANDGSTAALTANDNARAVFA